MYAVLLFFGFGSSSNALRGLGDDRRSRLSTSIRSAFKKSAVHDHNDLEAGWQDVNFDYETCPNLQAAREVSGMNDEVIEDCDILSAEQNCDGQTHGCGCWMKNKKYKNTGSKVRYVTTPTAEKCAEECKDIHVKDTADPDIKKIFLCKWWVWEKISKNCHLKDAFPKKWKNTDAKGEARWAGPPCNGS